MSKIKKVLALVLAMAMVMAMGITSFAREAVAGTSTITINGLTSDSNTNIDIYQVAYLDEDVNGGSWVFADWAEGKYSVGADGIYSFNWEAMKGAVQAADKYLPTISVTAPATTTTITVTEIGAYLIVANDANGQTTYAAMGTNTADYDSNTNLIKAVNAKVNAKPSTIKLTKTISTTDPDGNTVQNKQVAVGDTIYYTIETIFPSFDIDQTTGRTFSITDTPGAGIRIDGITSVKVGDSAFSGYTTNPSTFPATGAVTINFNEDTLADSTGNAGKKITVTVQATVIGTTDISNAAISSKNSTGDSDESYTSQATVTKVDATNQDVKLQGAQFVLATGTGADRKYAKFDTTKTFVEWVNDYTDSEGEFIDACIVETGSDGTATVYGLDGDLTYYFVEVKAPAGYSLNDADNTFTWTPVVNTNGTEEGKTGAVTVTDTKLTQLPSTGGIGTTIFTVVGCLIMIAAAAMFFVSRRRTEK